MSDEGCTARVWDNGDSTDCGAPVLRANRCAACLQRDVDYIRKELVKLDEFAGRLRKRLDELQTESG